MAKKAKESGRVARIFWSSADQTTLIGQLDEGTKFKGFLPSVHLGDFIEIHGKWFDHPRHGKQVDVQYFTFVHEHECDDFQREISDACKFLFEELELAKRGEKIFAVYQGRTREIVTKDPYQICRDVPEVGFSTADKIATKLGIDKFDIRRLDAKLRELIFAATHDHGHTCLIKSGLIQKAASELELDYDIIDDSIYRLCQEQTNVFGDAIPPELCEYIHDGRTLIYPRYLLRDEIILAESVQHLLETLPSKEVSIPEEDLRHLEPGSPIDLSAEQQEAIIMGFDYGLSIITGGPGVGKTTIVKKLVEIARKNNLVVDLCAYTGRAARRLGEAAGTRAHTIHKLLAYDPRTSKFKNNEDSPLLSDVVICDETSMVNIHIGSALIRAVRAGARCILVGDVDQLPPIGPGAMFRDLIATGLVPTKRLTHIFRQAQQSKIITGSRQILERQVPEFGTDTKSDDLFRFTYSNPSRGLGQVVDLFLQKIPDNFGIESKNIQILAPMYKGPLGIWAINEAIQKELHGGPHPHCNFAEGDRVIFSDRNDHDLGVMNGDIGIVNQIRTSTRKGKLQIRVTVEIDGVPYTFDEDQQKNLFLAYAISIHKCQGSEYPAAITLATPGGFPGFYNRNMLYTAITRGKQLSVIMGPTGSSTLQVIIDTGEKRRRSLLVNRIQTLSEQAA